MPSAVSITQRQLPDFLLKVALQRPVFIWGAPGIGKSALVQQFAEGLGLECISLLGSQLAPEDILGVPQILQGKTRFCPPGLIARDEPYCLFLDELNACSSEVQKSFYSLIHERRVGDYRLPSGSIVIGAGNRAQDGAIVKTMSSALMNRMVHVHLSTSAADWLLWAEGSGIHPLVLDYLRLRPDHLFAAPPKHEEPFSTPRSWHMLSDALHEYGAALRDDELKVLAHGCLTPAHATQLTAFTKQLRGKYQLSAILKGEQRWPDGAQDRDLLYFLAHAFRAHLAKELPQERASLSTAQKELTHRAKGLTRDLAALSVEMAQLVVAETDEGPSIPGWFLVDVVRDLPRLVASAR
jgi:MoxR-like ATPase